MDMLEQILLLLLATGVGFSGKLLWDKLNSNGDSKRLLMTKESCKVIREDCGIKAFKENYNDHKLEIARHSSKIDQQLTNIEHTLSINSLDVKDVKTVIDDIKTKLTQLITYVESSLSQRFKND